MYLKNLSEEIINPKNTRLIYVIDTKLSKEFLEKIIAECEIDFFSIDTQCFENVKEYFAMIEIIKSACHEMNKNIGIMAELAGRKIRVDSINLKDKKNENDLFLLKKGDMIKIYSESNSKFKRNERNEPIKEIKENSIIVNFNDIHKLVKVNDIIIINDNKGELKVNEIREKITKCNSQMILKNRIREENQDKKNLSMMGFKQDEDEKKINKFLDSPLIISQNKKISYNDISLVNLCKNKINQNNNNSIIIPQENKTESKLNKSNSETISISDEEKEEYANTYKDYGLMYERDENTIDEFHIKPSTDYLKRTARKNTIYIDSIKEYSNQGDIVGKVCASLSPELSSEDLRLKRQRICQRIEKTTKIFEIICEVNYDCIINKNSVLFVPNVDYTKLGMDVLTKREVAEINTLDEIGIDFISIGIKSMIDIESIREVNSNLNIIAILPDYTPLEELDEILDNTSGILLSRTFQILNEKNQNSITRLIKHVIHKCRHHGKPIFSFIDISDDFISRKRRISHVSEVMYNIIDGMDGFFLSIRKESKCDIIDTINYFVKYFKKILDDQFINEMEHFKEENKVTLHHCKNHIFSPFETQLNFIRINVTQFQHSLIAYFGDDLDDIKSITKMKLKTPLIVFFNNLKFLIRTRLFYSVFTIKYEDLIVDEIIVKNIENYLQNNFPDFNIIFVLNNRISQKKTIKTLGY